MIKQGEKIINARTGQVMLFMKTAAETDGELLEIDCISPPSDSREPEHIHPFQQNNFRILAGECTFRIDGKEQTAKAGDTVSIAPNVRHYFWNPGNVDARYRTRLLLKPVETHTRTTSVLLHRHGQFNISHICY